MAPESTPGASPMASQDLKAENSADEAREVPVSEQTLLKAISWDTKFKNKSVEEVDREELLDNWTLKSLQCRFEPLDFR